MQATDLQLVPHYLFTATALALYMQITFAGVRNCFTTEAD